MNVSVVMHDRKAVILIYTIFLKALILLILPYLLWDRIRCYFDYIHEKEIAQYGELVQGKIVKLQFYPFNRSLSRRYDCTPTVSFLWKGSHLQLKALTSVPRKKYNSGSNIELLYLPEYPRRVIVKGERLRSGIGFLWDTFIIAVCFIMLIIAIVNI